MKKALKERVGRALKYRGGGWRYTEGMAEQEGGEQGEFTKNEYV